ncbi:hypothetical protein ACSX1A_00515 [Pontibacter sp. MBLB2868]|uniref:hypothetical protein n=1 Tax=Pontibacter sp. MBLB2868 TaxID=3451555 RepID=UPI003F754808
MKEAKIKARVNGKNTHVTIYISCSVGRKVIRENTGVYIPCENWSDAIKRVVPNGKITKEKANEYNQIIGDLYLEISTKLDQLSDSDTRDDLMRLLRNEMQNEATAEVKQVYSLLDVCQLVIDHSSGDNPRRYTHKGGAISAKTIKQYNNTLNTLKDFEVSQGKSLSDWNYIGGDFYVDLKNYLYAKMQVDSSIDKLIKNLKSFLLYIYDEEVIDIPRLNLKKWKRINVTGQTVVYLLNDEYNILQQMPISEPHLDRTRDLFCFQTDNCLRVGDLMKVRRYHFNHDYTKMDITHEKTNTDTKHIQTAFSLSVIKKYKGMLANGRVIPNDITEQVYNRQLKEVIKLLATYIEKLREGGVLEKISPVLENCDKLLVRDLTVKVPFISTIRQKKKVEYDYLYNRFSSHDARSTFITCMLIAGENQEMIKKKSGHAANSPAFKRYFDISSEVMNQFVVKKQDKMFKKIDSQYFASLSA